MRFVMELLRPASRSFATPLRSKFCLPPLCLSGCLVPCNLFRAMFRIFTLLVFGVALSGQGHVVAWGGWKPITLASGQQIKIRPLMIDGRVKEYSTGTAHEITETLSVARRVFRLNNALPNKTEKDPDWVWQLGGWISVNSTSGHVAELKLPEFDPHNSEASWFQDYAAYCGATEDGNIHYMMVYQIGRRKPVLRKQLIGRSCPAPVWEKSPTRVTFDPPGGKKVSFDVHEGFAQVQAR